MSEMTPYFEKITGQRAMLLSEEDALEGCTTISLETQLDMSEEGIATYVEHNLPEFIRILRYLSKEDQELLLSYYLLAKTQNTLAVIHRTTQTLCSFLIRKAVERIGTFILLGAPSQEVISEILVRSELEDSLGKVALSKVVVLYEKTRSFQKVADTYGIHRPDVRRAMRKAAQKLEKSDDNKEKALGAFLQGLIEKASASGQGFSQRKMAKQGHIYKKDPDILGQFRVDVASEDFDLHCFTSRANR
jgi:hypothetical protein